MPDTDSLATLQASLRVRREETRERLTFDDWTCVGTYEPARTFDVTRRVLACPLCGANVSVPVEGSIGEMFDPGQRATHIGWHLQVYDDLLALIATLAEE